MFRIFLCDPMSPVIPPPLDKKAGAIEQPFSDENHNSVTEKDLEDAMRVVDSDRHGSDQRCVSCHRKLDPMGTTFQNIGLVMNPEPAPGALKLFEADGSTVNKPVTGLGELAQEIVKQPEYEDCQVQWLWQEFIGKDVPLAAEKKVQLVKDFNQVGRRTDDFIHTSCYIIGVQKEARCWPSQFFPGRASLLQRCDSLGHASEVYIPTFADGLIPPFELKKIRQKLHLPEGDPKKMPRDWRSWNPRDLELIKRWLEEGAVNSKGKAMLSADDRREAP